MIAIARRVLLFLVVNIFVVLSITIILQLLGIQPYLTENGIDPTSLAIFCVLWGSAGSFISLLLSKSLAIRTGNVSIIDPKTSNPAEKKVLDMVYSLAKRSGLADMPEVGIYKSPELNAFATGATKSSSLVAISTGLLDKMDAQEVEGVVGHEVSHITNGDMVTMTLLQGIVNSFAMFFSRLLAAAMSRDRDSGGSFGMVLILQNVLVFLGSIVVASFSRWRELRADVGGARLAGRQNMINALKALEANIAIQDPRQQKASFRSLQISLPGGFSGLFASHPPLKKRIERLQQMRDIP